MNVLLGMVGVVAVVGWPAMAEGKDLKDSTPNGRFIITLKAEADAPSIAHAHGLETKHVYNQLLHGWAGEIPLSKLKALATDPAVASIAPDARVSVGIRSTRLGGGTARMSGTSMAAPHVAGAVALLYEKAAALGIALGPMDAKVAVMNGDRIGQAPLDSCTSRGYYPMGVRFDGDREGILNVPAALDFLDTLVASPRAKPGGSSRRL